MLKIDTFLNRTYFYKIFIGKKKKNGLTFPPEIAIFGCLMVTEKKINKKIS